MNMKKPEMKLMRFVNEDVIATSGAPAFELRGFHDRQSGNLETFVDGIKYNGGSELKTALDKKYGGNGYNSLRFNFDYNKVPTVRTFTILNFNLRSPYDYDYSPLRESANGKYTYSEIDGDTIVFTQIKTQ